MNNPTIKELISAGLKAGGFDGLFNSFLDCACVIDDLMPCGNNCDNCEAGYIIRCDCRDHVVRDKPKE